MMEQDGTRDPAGGESLEAAKFSALSSIEVLLDLLQELDRSVGHADIPWLILSFQEARHAIEALDPGDAEAPARIAALSTTLKHEVHALLGQIAETGERHEHALAAAGRHYDQIKRWFQMTAAAAAAAEDFGRLADPRSWTPEIA